ncbi:MAG: PQQ-binding-like beta-propeller repeat protein [Myxococcales bacterium]|nr:PQQ-binding-like beta-propeller repeat protein [Myxococcales bacterium]
MSGHPNGAGRRAVAVGAVAIGLAAVACEGLPNAMSPELPLWVHHPGGALQPFVLRTLSAETRAEGEPWERSRPEIDFAHRRVFVGSSDRGLYALNAVNGATLWRFETDDAVHSEPLYDGAEDALYFGSNDGALYKVRAVDGALLWRFSTNAQVTRRPVVHRGVVYVANANDTLVAIHQKSGELLWYRHRQPALGMGISGYAGPTVHGDRVYAAFSDGTVVAYEAKDGAEIWSRDLTAEVEQARSGEELRYFDIDTTPIVTPVGGDEAVVFASYEGGLFARDARTGEAKWENEAVTGVTELTLWTNPRRAPTLPEKAAAAPAPSAGGATSAASAGPPSDGAGPAPAGGSAPQRLLVAASGSTGLWAIDPETGAEKWHRDLPAGGITAATTVAGAILVGTTRYGVFLFYPLDGGVIDAIAGGASFSGNAGACGTRAYILSNQGVLFGLQVRPPPPPRRG